MPKYTAKLAGFYLDIKSINDVDNPSVVVNKYPFSNTNLHENLGQEPRRIQFTTTWNNNTAITKGWSVSGGLFPFFDNHIGFRNRIKENQILTFTHPEYGEIRGSVVKPMGTLYDDRVEYCEITINFVEEKTTETPTYTQYVIPQTEASWRDTNTLTASTIAESRNDSANTISWDADANSYIDDLGDFLNLVDNPATSIINTVNYGTDIPGQVLESINQSIDRVVESFQTVRDSPAQYINNIIVQIRALKSIFTGANANQVHIMGAGRVAFEAANVYTEDEARRQDSERLENSQVFDAAGNYKGSVEVPEILTINELELSSSEVRKFIDEAINIDRFNRGLLNSARHIHEYVLNVRLTREKLVQLEDVPDQPLLSLLKSNNINYQKLNRILKLNPDIKNPNFTSGSVKIITQ